MLLSFFHRVPYFFTGALHSCLLENDFGFMSKKYCNPLYKGAVQNDATLCEERWDFMLGAQTMWKSTKHAHLDDIHEMWLSRHGPTTHGPPWACFSSLGFGNAGQQSQKPRENLSICSMLFAHCSSALASNSLYKTIQNPKNKTNKNSQWRSMIGWDIGFVFCVFFV